AEQDLGSELCLAVGGHQVVQVERERRGADPVTVRVSRWQLQVTQRRVEADVVQEEVELWLLILACLDQVRRDRGDRRGAQDALRASEGEVMCQQIEQRGRDAADGQVVAHRLPSVPCSRKSASETLGRKCAWARCGLCRGGG